MKLAYTRSSYCEGGVQMETSEWIKNELRKLAVDEKSTFIVNETLAYIDEIKSDNESLQIALEGELWSPKKWNEKPKP